MSDHKCSKCGHTEPPPPPPTICASCRHCSRTPSGPVRDPDFTYWCFLGVVCDELGNHPVSYDEGVHPVDPKHTCDDYKARS